MTQNHYFFNLLRLTISATNTSSYHVPSLGTHTVNDVRLTILQKK